MKKKSTLDSYGLISDWMYEIENYDDLQERAFNSQMSALLWKRRAKYSSAFAIQSFARCGERNYSHLTGVWNKLNLCKNNLFYAQYKL